LFFPFLSRHLDFDNTIPLVEAFKGLFNFFYLTRDVVLLNQPSSDIGWGSEEVSIALNPIITFFAMVSTVLLFCNNNTSYQKKLLLFSLTLIVIGLLFSCNETIWLYIKYITSNSIRVSSRFLVLSQFGILLLAGYSIDYFIKTRRDYNFRLIIGLIFVSAGIFTLEILNSNTNFYKDRFNTKYEFQNKIQCYDKNLYLQDSDLIVSNFYHVVGNKQHLNCTEGLIDKRLQIGNSEIQISILNPNEQLYIPFDLPYFGFTPQKIEGLKLLKMDHGFVAENFSGKNLKNIKLRVYFPVPLIIILINFFTILILIIFVFSPIDYKKFKS
jgi:hypothetical protein